MSAPPRVWPRLWAFVRPYRLRVALTLLLALLATPLSLVAPLPLRIAVDSIIGNQPMPGALALPLHWLGLSSVIGRLVLVAAFLVAITVLIYAQGLLAW